MMGVFGGGACDVVATNRLAQISPPILGPFHHPTSSLHNSQSIAWDTFLRENPEWAFRTDSAFCEIFEQNSNDAAKSSMIDNMAKTCGACNLNALEAFVNAVGNKLVKSSVVDCMLPHISKGVDVTPVTDKIDRYASLRIITYVPHMG